MLDHNEIQTKINGSIDTVISIIKNIISSINLSVLEENEKKTAIQIYDKIANGLEGLKDKDITEEYILSVRLTTTTMDFFGIKFNFINQIKGTIRDGSRLQFIMSEHKEMLTAYANVIDVIRMADPNQSCETSNNSRP